MSVVGSPAGKILKQPDRTNSPVAAKIKPVKRTARHADQVAGFHLNRHDRTLFRMHVKQSASRDDVANLNLVMPMLSAESGEHSIQARSFRSHVDYVRCYISATRLELIDLPRVSMKDLFSGGIGRQLSGRLPAFIVDADSAEKIADLFRFAEGAIFFWNANNGHGSLPSRHRSKDFRKSSPKRPTRLRLPSEILKSRRGAWLPLSSRPKYITHARAEGIHECRVAHLRFSKQLEKVRPCPANSLESATIRDVHGFEHLRAPSASHTLHPRLRLRLRERPKEPCSIRSECAARLPLPGCARSRDAAAPPQMACPFRG